MEQLRTLIWVKWRILASQLRSSRALMPQILLWGFGGVMALLSLLFAAGLFAWLYTEAGEREPEVGRRIVTLVLLLVQGSIYVVWAMAGILPTRAGGTFDPSNLLHYPLSLRRLFVLDLSSELLKGMTLFLLPSIIALHVAVPAAGGRALWGVLPLLCTLAFGTLLAKTLELLVALLNRRGPHAAETLVAGSGIVLTFGILLIAAASPQLKFLVLHSKGILTWILWSTPLFLSTDLQIAALRGDSARYLRSLAAFALYVPPLFWVCFRIWRRLATGEGGGKGSSSSAALPAPWRVPLLSEHSAALLEKELKYLLRNPQVRILLIMPATFLLFKLGIFAGKPPSGRRRPVPLEDELSWLAGNVPPLHEGFPIVFATGYLLLFYGVLFNNMFGLDGQGVKSYLLAPVPRITLLRIKNLALILLMTMQGVVLLGLNQLFFKDLKAASLVVAVTSFASGVALMAGSGNLISIWFPRQSTYGKRLEASRWAVVLMFVQVPLALLPVVVAFLLCLAFDSVVVKYLALVLGMVVSWGIYLRWLLPRAADAMALRETMIVETVTGGDE